MEQTASIAILPQQRWHRPTRARTQPGEVVAFRARSLCRSASPKRVAVIDPFPIERRLLTALAEAQGNTVLPHGDADSLLAERDWAGIQIALVHVCHAPLLRDASLREALPPIVLIDPYSLGAGASGALPEVGIFPTLRFPIGLWEVATAIERNAR